MGEVATTVHAAGGRIMQLWHVGMARKLAANRTLRRRQSGRPASI